MFVRAFVCILSLFCSLLSLYLSLAVLGLMTVLVGTSPDKVYLDLFSGRSHLKDFRTLRNLSPRLLYLSAGVGATPVSRGLDGVGGENLI